MKIHHESYVAIILFYLINRLNKGYPNNPQVQVSDPSFPQGKLHDVATKY